MSAGFWLKMKGNHTLWSKGQKCYPITRRPVVITWIGGPTSEANRRNKGSGAWQYNKDLLGSFLDEGGDRRLGPLFGRPHWSVNQGKAPPTFPFGEQLQGDFPRSVQDASCAETRPNYWWTSSINMRGEAPNRETPRCSHSSINSQVAYYYCD